MTGAGDSSSRRGRRPARLEVRVAARGTRAALAHEAVAALAADVLRAEGVRDAQLSVTFVDPPTMARLNRQHLGHRGPTDVITFALAAVPGAPVTGDAYICPAVARDHARAHGVGVREETARLVVHAALHVLGHEHPEDDSRVESAMWRLQERYLRRFCAHVEARP